jgi:hypothetical protein
MVGVVSLPAPAGVGDVVLLALVLASALLLALWGLVGSGARRG